MTKIHLGTSLSHLAFVSFSFLSWFFFILVSKILIWRKKTPLDTINLLHFIQPMTPSDFLLWPTIIFLLHYSLLLDSFPVDTNTEVLKEGGECDLCSELMDGFTEGMGLIKFHFKVLVQVSHLSLLSPIEDTGGTENVVNGVQSESPGQMWGPILGWEITP